MNDKNRNLKEMEAVLRWNLPELLESNRKPQNQSPTAPEMVDLIEDRLDATDREELLERLAADPEGLEELSDLLHGYDLSEGVEASSGSIPAPVVSPLEVVRNWLQQFSLSLSPATCPYSAEGEEVAPGVLEGLFENRLRDVMNLLEGGDDLGEILSVQANAMEVYLDLLQAGSAPPDRFAQTWRSLCEETGTGFSRAGVEWTDPRDWSSAYRYIGCVYERALDLSPDRVEAHVGLARLNLGRDLFEKAEEHLKAALSLSPADEEANRLLTQLESRKKNRS